MPSQLQSLSVPRARKGSAITCMSSCRSLRGWGGSTFLLSPKLKTPGPCLEEAGCFGVIASGLFFPSSHCKLFRWQHQRSERSTGKKSQVNALYSLGSSVQRALLALWIRGCVQPQNIPIIAYSWGNWGMGLLKRDLARASAEPQPELGGASCPLTAPLHLQKHAASLQQLAKGCTRETLLLYILPLLSYMAILLPWQLAERHSRAAPHLHPACWPATLALYLWYIYIYP